MENFLNMKLEDLLELEKSVLVLSEHQFMETIPFQLLFRYFLFRIFKNEDILLHSRNQYEQYRKELPIYQITDSVYNFLLDELVSIIKKIPDINNPLSLSILFGDALIPDGFLSYTNSFHCTYSDKMFRYDDDYSIHGYDNGKYIFCGYGCCRHVSYFMNDVFHRLGIASDFLPCIYDYEENIEKMIFDSVDVNHAINGFLWEGKYYLVDILNQNYILTVNDRYVDVQNGKKIVLNYSRTPWFQESISWNPALPYGTFDVSFVNQKVKEICDILYEKDMKYFIQYKNEFFHLFEILAYLVPLESNRSIEKEHQKAKENIFYVQR